MKNLTKTAFIISLFFLSTIIYGQNEDRLTEVQEITSDTAREGWTSGIGAGLDFLQLLQLNPKVGAGENKIQFGGVGTAFANYLNGRFSWDNSASLLFGVQRLGTGINPATNESLAFQKTIDELRLTSLASYKTSEESRWAYSADLTILSQLTPTYFGSYLKDVDETDEFDGPISKFFSPAHISFAPGISYIQSENFQVLFSPASIKMIVVADDDIASIPGDEDLNIGLHGTGWRSPTDFDNMLFQLGATLKAKYNNKYLNDRLIHTSELTLFSNYLENPQNIDVDFRNQIAYEIWKGLQIALNLNFFYDHNIPVQITDYDSPNGVKLDPDGTPELGKRLNIVESLTIKYNIVF